MGNHLSSSFVEESGVPQSRVLSVALFAVVINGIGDGLSAAVGRSLFVDDLAMWYASPSARHIARQPCNPPREVVLGERYPLLNGEDRRHALLPPSLLRT